MAGLVVCLGLVGCSLNPHADQIRPVTVINCTDGTVHVAMSFGLNGEPSDVLHPFGTVEAGEARKAFDVNGKEPPEGWTHVHRIRIEDAGGAILFEKTLTWYELRDREFAIVVGARGDGSQPLATGDVAERCAMHTRTI